ncbi:carbohydrate ABC transporter permease [Paenibacillus sp. GCM10027628]|uniref:carbohydrate ABC transporter permease n=1 Tax=Paenibacillus sp. GCM10027628 TaxID=3273413 RepID=UPI0036398C9C
MTKKIFIHAVLIFFCILFVAPFFWMVLTAVKIPTETFVFPPIWIPSKIELNNFVYAWTVMPFNTFLKNSLAVTGFGLIGQLISSSLVAYGFARFSFKGRNVLFIILLSTMMIPWDVTAIPLYMEFNMLGWINTLKPLIIPTWFGSAYFVFLLRQFLMSIPKELEEAATIDGANAFQIYLNIFVPLMVPSLIVVGVFQMMNSWNDYLGPLIFLNDQSKYTLTLGLSQFKGNFGVDMTSIMATTFLICIPPLIIFFIAQRYILDGLANTGIKG